jgi:hypothetical protein
VGSPLTGLQLKPAAAFGGKFPAVNGVHDEERSLGINPCSLFERVAEVVGVGDPVEGGGVPEVVVVVLGFFAKGGRCALLATPRYPATMAPVITASRVPRLHLRGHLP